MNEGDEGVVCLVVAAGAAAFEAVRGLAHAHTRYWRLVAVGHGASVAKGDRTILPDDHESPAEWHARVRQSLEPAWCHSGEVCVVVDPTDEDAMATADAILSDARALDRAVVLITLGDEGLATADVVLRLDSSCRSRAAECIRGYLTPYESCVVPADLYDVVLHARALRRGRLFSTQCRLEDLGAALVELVGAGFLHRVRAVHLLAGEGLTFRAMKFIDRLDGEVPECSFAASMDFNLLEGEAILTLVVADPVPRSSDVGARLRSLVESRISLRLPRNERARVYGARLRHELDWWTADDTSAGALLALHERVAALVAKGYVPAPFIRRAGGSLVAYVLGLSAFDPVEWALSFLAFTDGETSISLEIGASLEATNREELPAYDGERPFSFYLDPSLDALERPEAIHREQMTEIIARGFGVDWQKANGLRHGLDKCDGESAIAQMRELGQKRYSVDSLEDILQRVILRGACSKSRSEALADALTGARRARC